MSYRLKLNETVAAGAGRIGLEQIDIAEARLASRDDLAAAIHDARRCLKRLRALLRLIRPALADSTYRREINRIAGAGKLLSDARDQHVMRQTLANLEARFGTLPRSVRTKLTRLMANGAATRNPRTGARERREALERLEQVRAFFRRLDRRQVTIEHVAAGLERSYRRARRTFRDAYENPSDEAFHDWRKAVQQHWRHMQSISRAWPDVLGGRTAEAKELSRLLGNDHDLHVLLTFAKGRGSTVLSADELESLTKICRTVQDELRKTAKPRGARLFAEPASNLRERMLRYWSAARDLAALVPSRENGKRERAPMRRGVPGRRRAAPQAASRGSPSPRPRRTGR